MLNEEFKKIYPHHQKQYVFFSPGRVNLIGEHIDYNGGNVLPAALQMGTYAVVGKRSDLLFRFTSLNFLELSTISCDMKDLTFDLNHGWANYAKGILYTLIQKGYKITHGFDILIQGDLPTASGLSSSASLEVLIAYIANSFYDLGLTRKDIALLSQEVENVYMHMHCGIMDQLIIACGKKNKALLMNTDTLETIEVDAFFKGYQWIIMNTNYKRKTTDSKYNERRKECNLALEDLKKGKDIKHLCELSIESFLELSHLISDEINYKRAKHAVYEQQRTTDAMHALNQGDAQRFGELLDQSHQSLKEDFEVTGIHLDTLVEAAKQAGAIGARVTGAGFGGCAIALVPDAYVNDFDAFVSDIYTKKTGLTPEFYRVTFEDGVRLIHENI